MRIKKAYGQPGRGDVHVNRPLTQISLAFMQMSGAFIASRVFPGIPVESQSDVYFTYPRGEWNRDEMDKRAPGTESAGGDYTLGTDKYFAEVYAYHKDVDDQIRANQDRPINLDRESTEYVTLKALIRREKSWVSQYFKTNLWSFEADGASARSPSLNLSGTTANDVIHWSDAAGTPIEDIRLAKRTVLESTGFMPNVLTLGRPVFDTLVDHPDIVGRLDRGQTAGAAMANKESLAALFEVEEILCMDSIENTSIEGKTDVHAFIGGKHALLSYRPMTPGIMTPAAGYTFNWTGYVGATPEGARIKRFRMEHLNSDRIEGEIAFDQKLVAADLGCFFNGIVA